MDTSTRSFRDDLEAKLAAIERVLRSAHLEQGRRDGAVRRLARLLGASAQAHGLPEVARAADELERSTPFTLPGAAQRLLVVLRRVVQDPILRRACVLVVSTDAERRKVLMDKLARPERELVCANDPAEAERLLATKDVAVLLVEAGTLGPTLEGLRLIERLRARPREGLLPVIALCAPDELAACYARGADACVASPHDPEIVSAATEAALRRVGAIARACRKDPLTGLLNREGLVEAYVRMRASTSRSGDALSLAVIELDGAGKLFDTYGKAAVEEALRHLSTVLGSVLRRDDLVGSWEDDRLVALLPVPLPGALRALQKGLKAVTSRPCELPGFMVVPLSFSAGVAEVGPSSALDEVFAEAERRLWLARTSGKTGVHAAADEPAGSRPRVLVALNDHARATEVAHRLTREGFDVVNEVEGAEVLKIARGGTLAACVLETRLAGRDGFQVLERLRRGPVAARLPVLLVTAGGREGDVARGFELGADDQIGTPFSITELVVRVRRLLKRRPGTARLDADGAGGVVGSFVGDQLIEFVQMLGLSLKTGVVRVTCDTFSGVLYFEQGRIVGASTSLGSSALEAAFEVILSPHGRFAFEPGLPLGVRRDLALTPDGFLLDAVRRRDEGRRVK